MSLSCGCDVDDYSWWYIPDEWFASLQTKRMRKCTSCGEKIAVGDECLKFDRFRRPDCEYEDSRFRDEVPLAPHYMCEKCGEIFLNLNAYGYCITLGGDIREDLRDHWAATGFKPQVEAA